MQPLPENAKRCPNCRTPRPRGRGVPIFLGIAGLIALILFVYAMVAVMRYEESQGSDSSTSQPEKTPPLNRRGEPASSSPAHLFGIFISQY
jgi:hypothetical protein